MSGGRGLYVPGRGRLYRLPSECKLTATLLFVIAVVATPREAIWAFALFAVMVLGLALRSAIPLPVLARRLALELPFLGFALLLPFVATGERIEVVGVELSRAGIWAGWNIFAKASLGFASVVMLLSATPVPQLLRGLERLGMPYPFIAIAASMVRYADLIAADMERMKVARAARGYELRWLWQARALAGGVGVLFIRSYERGERVHLAMMARGYAGTSSGLTSARPGLASWMLALAPAAIAAAVAAAAWTAHW